MDLNKARIPRIQQVVDLLEEYGLIDLVRHFFHRRMFWNLKTWYQLRQGNVLLLICNQILVTDRRLFKLVGIQYMHNCLSDHFALIARLLRRPTHCHSR